MQLADLLVGGTRQLDAVLFLGAGWTWALLVVGLVALLVRVPALGTAAIAATSMGLLATTPSAPWELLSWFPGMSAVNYPQRLQWALLVFAPIGLAVPLGLLPRQGRAGLVVLGVVAGVAWSGFAGVNDEYPLQAPGLLGASSDAGRPSARGRVTGATTRAERHLSISPLDGLAHPELALRFDSPDGDDFVPPGSGLVRSAGRTGDEWPAGEGAASADLGVWSISGPPGGLVEVRQRDIWGWDCGGARRVQAVATGAAWLQVQLDDDGRAQCAWTSPGLAGGALLQGLGVAGLLAIVGVGVRRRPKPDGAVAGEDRVRARP